MNPEHTPSPTSSIPGFWQRTRKPLSILSLAVGTVTMVSTWSTGVILFGMAVPAWAAAACLAVAAYFLGAAYIGVRDSVARHRAEQKAQNDMLKDPEARNLGPTQLNLGTAPTG